MSNRVFVEVNKVDDDMWDVKVSDDFDTGNIVLFETPPVDDIDLLKVLRQHAEEDARHSPQAERVQALLDFVEENEKGVFIRDTFYDFKEIATVFS